MPKFRSTFVPATRVPWRTLGGYTETGDTLMVDAGLVGVSGIKVDLDSPYTSVRTDSSGSKSRAKVEAGTGRVLIEPDFKGKIGDALLIDGSVWRIDSMWVRRTSVGIIDHFQADITLWR